MTTCVVAEYKKVSIGTIDRYYKNKLTKEELTKIVKEIEIYFETKLGFDVFGLTNDGSPINILYVKPSLAQKRLDRYMQKFEKKKILKKELEEFLDSSKKPIEKLIAQYDKEASKTKKLINKHNIYLNKINKKKNLSQDEYNEIKIYDKKKRKEIKKQEKKAKNLFKKLKSHQRKYNRSINKYNNLIRALNTLSKNIENLSRSIKVVKGNAISNTEITKKSYMRNGEVFKVETQTHLDEKIEIYGFENKIELKTVIAHEIAHLVGIPHISSRGALMNPILQENQKKRLELTKDDIVNFKKHF